MPPPSLTQLRLNNIISCFAGPVDCLVVLAESFHIPFFEPVSRTVQSLLTAAQTVKQNKNECVQLMEKTYGLLYAIVSLQAKSDSGADMPISTLNHLAKFVETLQKIHTYVEAQQNKSKIRHFFRQGEMITLLKDCNAGLQEALDVFQVEDIDLLRDVTEMKEIAEERRDEVLDLIESISDGISDRASSTNKPFAGLYASSNSISMLPSEPKIFHGRESELWHILKCLDPESSTVAILGAAGMGKTSLARAVLHHPQIINKFEQHRFFVACDSVSTQIELAALLGTHIGLQAGRDLTRPVIWHLSKHTPCLLVLDNLETVWEPPGTQKDIEEFLSLLTDIQHLALIITMRGEQRPSKVQWTRPFLPPLKPLAQDAARQVFVDIADEGHDIIDIDKVLLLTANMPLAINLMAHLADTEGCSEVLFRWEEEKTSLISAGHDKRSNLDLSISLSLTSPRMTSLPQSQDLLSVLSLLPDGLSDMDLIRSKLPINDILHCQAVLRGTSLAYTDAHKRLKTLAPIREYMNRNFPPTARLVKPLFNYFQELLEGYKRHSGTPFSFAVHAQISSNFANIQKVLWDGLFITNSHLVDTIYCACDLERFSLVASRGHITLFDHIPALLPQPTDHRLEVHFITTLLASWRVNPIDDPQDWVQKGLQHLPHVDDQGIKAAFYHALAEYGLDHFNIITAMDYCQTALSLETAPDRQSAVLCSLAMMRWKLGNYHAGRIHATEAQRLARISGCFWKLADALRMDAMCSYALGNYKSVLSLCSTARELLSLSGMCGGDSDHEIMATQAEVHRLKSEYVEARNIQNQILLNTPIEEEPYGHGFALMSISEVDVTIGATSTDVWKNLGPAKQLFHNMGHSVGVTMCDTIAADLDLRDGRLPTAQTLFETCLSFAWGRQAEMITYCLERLGNGSRWGINHWSSSWTILYLAYSLKSRQNLDIHKALQFLGDQFLSDGSPDTAYSLFTVALEGFTDMDVHRNRAECMFRLGDISKQQGDFRSAREFWKAARPLFKRSCQITQIGILDERLSDIPEETAEEYGNNLDCSLVLGVPDLNETTKKTEALELNE